jgi:hypothetical protein
MAYSSWSVVFGEQPSAAKWNILGTNDAAFNNGTGIPSANSVSAYVATSEGTTSTSFVDLATTTDTVTAIVGSTGKLLISLYHWVANSGANSSSCGFALTSANTLAAADEYSTFHIGTTTEQMNATFLLTGLNAGSTVVKMKYKTSSGTATFDRRRILAVPL